MAPAAGTFCNSPNQFIRNPAWNTAQQSVAIPANESPILPQPSALRRNLGLDLVDDPKYKGVTVSRKQLMGASDDDEDDDDDNEEIGEGFEESGSQLSGDEDDVANDMEV